METETFKVPHQISETDRFKQKFPGRGAPKQSDFLRKKLSGKAGAKYFDSGDYNVAKANRKKDAIIMTGKAIPVPHVLPQRKPSSSKQVTTLGGDSPTHAESSSPPRFPTDEKEEELKEHEVQDEMTQTQLN